MLPTPAAPSPWHDLRLKRGWLCGFGAAIVICALCALARPARADTFVLVVANNRSLRAHLPDLQYADDDAIRYYQLWGALLPGARLSLLASLDTGTARSHPSFVGLAHPPTRPGLVAESRALAAAVRAARAAGRETTFYFVFAGHGDVEAGQGFIELADARFGARDLDALLDEVGAAESHVIIDSCNSFFMINPRKPGGRRWTSGEGVSKGGASRAAPNVGSFLSTSSEQLTYEWSETQSGIFSYLVRSGLMGAADANGDGRISYDELAAFVGVASGAVPNVEARPHVFSRGPGGDGRRMLVDLRPSAARALEAPAGRRLVLRDAQGFRMGEVNTEASFSPGIRLWGSSSTELSVLSPPAEPAGRPSWLVYDVPQGEGPLAWETLSARPATELTRGGDRLFEALFSEPFGPRALKRYWAEQQAAPPPVFGLSRADSQRLRLNLQLLESSQRDERLTSALWELTFSVPFLAAGILEREPAFYVSAALMGGLAIKNMFPSWGERRVALSLREIEGGRDPSLWLPGLRDDLDAMARSAWRWRVISACLVGTFSALVILVAFYPDPGEEPPTTDNLLVLGFGGVVATWLAARPEGSDRLIDAIRGDEQLWQGIAVAPVPYPNGAGMSLSSRF